MCGFAVGMMIHDILEATRRESETKQMGIIEFIINCLKPVYEWLQALFWGKDEPPRAEPFNISEYSRRREKLILELEEEYRVEYTIVLWWSYDGLRLNKDGSFEWISRKPLKPIEIPRPREGRRFSILPRNIFEECVNAAGIIDRSMCQCTQAQIDELRTQLAMQSANALAYRPGYSANSMSIYGSLTGCCYNQTILR